MSEIDDLYNSAKTRICSPDEGELLVDPVTLKVTSTDLVTNLQKYVTLNSKCKYEKEIVIMPYINIFYSLLSII